MHIYLIYTYLCASTNQICAYTIKIGLNYLPFKYLYIYMFICLNINANFVLEMKKKLKAFFGFFLKLILKFKNI